jgi:phage major head subunit gpT-like protein
MLVPITTARLQNLSAGYQTLFNDAVADLLNTVPIFWPDLALEIPSSALVDVFGYLKNLPGYREWIDDRQVFTPEAGDYQIVSKKFELTLGIPRDAIAYDRLGLYNNLAKAIGGSARTFRDELLFPLVKGGNSMVGPDGQYFYDTDHPLTDKSGNPTTASNYQSGAGPLWFVVAKPYGMKPFIITKQEELDLVTLFDPTNERVFYRDEFVWGSKGRFGAGFFLWQLIQASNAALTDVNFNAAFTALATRLGDRGKKMPMIPTDAYFPYSMRADANQQLLAERLANGASNTNFKVVNVHYVPYLDWA